MWAAAANAQKIQILTRDAVVWAQEQSVWGTLDTAIANQGEISANGAWTPFQASAESDSFSVDVVLGEGTSSLVAAIDSAGTPLYSDTLRLTLGYDLRPEILLSAAVDSSQIVLHAGVLRNPDGFALSFSWREDEDNPAAALWLTAADSSVTIGLPAEAPHGEYYYEVEGVSVGGDTVTARTFVTRDSTGIRPFQITTDHAAWIDRAVIYQVTPYIFVARGTFPRITAKLSDIKNIGATTVWLQPVYATGYGGQGYDVTDYFKLRTDLGSETELRTLITTAHSLGLKVLFDFVPNHTSILHPYAQDAIQHGRQSHYYDFYQREYKPVPYSMHYNTRHEGEMTFVYYFWPDLPSLNYDNPEVQRMITEAGKYWIEKFDIDGYRIDAVWGVNARRPEFFQEWRLAMKRIKPEILLLGEDKASWYSTFDKRFDAAYDWAAGEPWVSEWEWAADYSPSSNPTIFNFTSQNQRATALHASLTNNGAGYHPRAKILRFMENNDTFRFRETHDDARTRMVAAMMFSLPGIPLLYNGQEIGATGHPYNTYEIFLPGFSIPGQDQFGLYPYYQRLSRLRNRFVSLTSDTMARVASSPSAYTYGYRRWSGNENVFVLVNMGNVNATGQLSIPTAELVLDSARQYYFTDLVTNESFAVTMADMNPFSFPIDAYSTRMFVLADTVVITSFPAPDQFAGVPAQFNLMQNYPNPFNSGTTMDFAVPGTGHVRLTVYDVLGRQVARPVDEERPAGAYRVPFDASGLSSGMYFYHLQWNDESFVKRMLLVK